MAKLLASDIIEIDDAFIEKIVTKLNKKDSERVYKTEEVAQIVKKDVQTIRKHIKASLLKATKKGKEYLITHDNLINYINK